MTGREGTTVPDFTTAVRLYRALTAEQNRLLAWLRTQPAKA